MATSCSISLDASPIEGGAKRVAPPPAGTTVIFKSLGQAVEDTVAARLVYRAALAEGARP